MKFNKHLLLTLMLAVLLSGCNDINSEKVPPQITAQGFIITEVQEGVAGQFKSLKLRIESTGRIHQLHIKERSYEVDLATTPERGHFPLFGIAKKTMLHTDVTLDLANYINQKLSQPGQYVFNIMVSDKQGQTVSSTLTVHVLKPPDNSSPIETSKFQLMRQGKNPVSGADAFGVTWKTIDKIKVTVRVTKASNGANKLAQFSPSDYEQLTSKNELSKKIEAAQDIDLIEFDAANNAAAGQVFGVSRQGNYYMLKTDNSNTVISSIGTTVMLNGEYKF